MVTDVVPPTNGRVGGVMLFYPLLGTFFSVALGVTRASHPPVFLAATDRLSCSSTFSI